MKAEKIIEERLKELETEHRKLREVLDKINQQRMQLDQQQQMYAQRLLRVMGAIDELKEVLSQFELDLRKK